MLVSGRVWWVVATRIAGKEVSVTRKVPRCVESRARGMLHVNVSAIGSPVRKPGISDG